ncbi:MAG: CapA family protein, partial [Clostridia bacterium]|nr:CapA family protein [Clostridia bacterium]
MGSTRIVFTGDIAFSRYYKEKVTDESIIGDDVLSFLKDADHGVFNVEGAVSKPTHAGTFVHTNDPVCAGFLKKMGGDIWNLANNHMFDAGPEGCADTVRHAHDAGARTIGAGANISEAAKPVIIESSGGIGILSATRTGKTVRATKDTPGCLSCDDTDKMRETVEEIKKTCRWCVMVIHSGKEFLDIPDKNLRARYRSYLDMGADIIVAHHPHVPQNYETVGDKAIFYSLGNFIFDTDYQRSQF